MDLMLSFIILGASIYASYKMALDKSQNKIGWPVAAAMFGPAPVIIQYIASDVAKGKKDKSDDYMAPLL